MKFIKKDNQKNYLASIEAFPQQIEQTWEEFKAVRLPAEYNQVTRVIINGMGGSSFGGLVAKALFADQLKVPLEVTNSYAVPAYVDEQTLFVFASYSGSTEEVLASVGEALRKGAKGFGITSGGKLAKKLEENKVPFFQFEPRFNPSGQPRAGLGYSITAVIALLNKAGLIKIENFQFSKLIKELTLLGKDFSPQSPQEKNPAKQIAESFKEKIAILVASDFLAGSLHIFRNQLHETAKNYANFFLLPELNHHLMEALSHPQTNPQNLSFLFISSELYHPRVQKRLEITQEVVQKNQIQALEYSCRLKNKFAQAFEVILLGSYTSFYLASFYRLDPTRIPWVDYFKSKLKD